MRFGSHILGNVAVGPSKRGFRRLRRRMLSGEEKKYWLVLCLPFVLMILCLNLWNSKARYRTIRTLQPLTDQHGLAECASSVVSTLSTFDPYVKLEKDAGIYENDFENRFQEDVWDTILSNYAVFPSWSDMRWNIPQYGRALALDMSIVQALAASTLSQRSRGIARSPVPYQHPTSTIHINYVHHRLDRLRGLQFAVNFNQRGAGSNASRFNLLVENSLNKVNCLMSKRVSVVSPPIYILLPYSEREHRLRLFLQNFAELYTQHDDNVILIISILRDRRHDHLAVRSIKDEVFRNDYATVSDKVWIHENDGDTNHQFSRGVALREAAKLVPDPTSVLFQCDVDMIILPTFFDRCKHNTVLDSQVYYPVFYSLYPYANAHPSIAERNGFWRKTSFGMVCIRKGDFDSVGAFDDAEIRFQGWGSEDVYQYEKIRNTSNLVAFRAVDPSLLHRWHTKHCDRASGAYTECMKTNFVTMGDPIRIGPALLESVTDVDALFARLQES